MQTLFRHQQSLLDKNPARSGVFWGVGTGKTITALALAEKNNVRAIIIVPKALKLQWERQAPQHLVITKETFRRDHAILPAFEAVVVDECHHFFSMKSQMSKALAKYLTLHNPPFIWLLSATPLTSSPWSIYRAAQFLGRSLNYRAFQYQYFYEMRLGHRTVLQPRKDQSQALATLIRSIGSVVSIDECADVPDQVFETEYFPLTPPQTKAIANLQSDTHIARFTAVHQLQQGCLKSDGYTEDQTFPSLKNERIIELCKENDKVLVFARYHLQLDTLQALLQKEFPGRPVLLLSGKVKNRDQVIQEAEGATSCILLCQSDTAEGWEAPSFPLVVFASLSFSFLKYQQACGRVQRINALKKNVYIHLITEGGPDEAIWQAIQARSDFYVELYQFSV